jgi:HEAT repeat protein
VIALSVLAALGQAAPETLGELPGLLVDPDVEIRRSSLRLVVLLKSGAASLEPALLAALKDKDPQVVILALWAISEVCPQAERLFESLVDLWEHGDRETRGYAPIPLARFGARAVPIFVQGLGDSLRRDAAVNALHTLGPTAHEALPQLEGLLHEHPKDHLLRLAIEAIRGEEKK